MIGGKFMTAYLHIVTVKTGTTTIKKFLLENTERFSVNGFCFSRLLGREENMGKDAMLDSIQGINWKIKQSIRREMENVKCRKALFSTEGLHANCRSKDDVLLVLSFFRDLGFLKIKIVVYLRRIEDLVPSLYSQIIKHNFIESSLPEMSKKYRFYHDCDYKTVQTWLDVFGKESLIVRLFDKNEFYQGDLLRDFVHSIGLRRDNNFILPPMQNETLDLLGISLLPRISRENIKSGLIQLWYPYCKYFQSKDVALKFYLPKDILQSYIDYFEKSNEWARKEFFPQRDLANYKENYELKKMKPEYWDKIAQFLADIVKTKNQIIQKQTSQIQIQNKEILDLNSQNSLLAFRVKHGTAKQRIQNHLAYKLGQAMIINSKSILGSLSLPFILLSLIISHKQEQKTYQEKMKNNPTLKFPPLNQYPDYKEALREKECFTYKLGEALMKADRTWYRGVGGIFGCYLRFGS